MIRIIKKWEKRSRRHCTSSNRSRCTADDDDDYDGDVDGGDGATTSHRWSIAKRLELYIIWPSLCSVFVQLNQIHLWRPGNHAASHFELNYDDECDFMDFCNERKSIANVILCATFFLLSLNSQHRSCFCCCWFFFVLSHFFLVGCLVLALISLRSSTAIEWLLYKQCIRSATLQPCFRFSKQNADTKLMQQLIITF